MNSLQVKAAIAGIFFGAWPLLMNRSKMEGNVSSAFFSLVVLLCVLPFAISGIKDIPSDVNWKMAVGAGMIGACGVMCFNGMLAKASKENVGSLFVVMIIVQTAIAAAYYVCMNGGISPTKGVGFLLAFAAAILLTK